METEVEKKDIENQIIKKEKKAPILLIIMSGLSFIPLIGVVFGLISIVISLFNFRRFKLLFILGLSGIIFTIAIYSTFYYFGSVKRGGTYEELKDILKVNNDLTLKDPITHVIKNYKGDSLFYYKATPDSFLLFSVGFDGKPFTTDDIYPKAIDSLAIMKK